MFHTARELRFTFHMQAVILWMLGNVEAVALHLS